MNMRCRFEEVKRFSTESTLKRYAVSLKTLSSSTARLLVNTMSSGNWSPVLERCSVSYEDVETDFHSNIIARSERSLIALCQPSFLCIVPQL